MEAAQAQQFATPELNIGQAAAAPLGGQEDLIMLLRRELDRRDALIAEMAERLDRLERRLDTALTDESPPVPELHPARAVVGETEPPAAAAATNGVSATERSRRPADAGPVAQAQAEEEAAPATPPQPGLVEADEEAAERALERTLVQTGVVLLPFGKAEIQPTLRYARRVENVPRFVINDDDSTFVGEDEVRRNEITAQLGLRLGLPLDSQLELDLPYRVVNTSTVVEVGGQGQEESEATGIGFGDLGIGLAKTLMREDGWWPDLVGRLRWDTTTGDRSNNGVLLGGGFNEFGVSLNATKRLDPLVFTSRFSYETTLKENGVKPGDEYALAVGAILAASPETSLRMILDQRYVGEVEIDGSDIPGSDDVTASLTIGAATILAPSVLLDGAVGVGLTDSGTDYAVAVSLPIRFNLPIW